MLFRVKVKLRSGKSGELRVVVQNCRLYYESGLAYRLPPEPGECLGETVEVPAWDSVKLDTAEQIRAAREFISTLVSDCERQWREEFKNART